LSEHRRETDRGGLRCSTRCSDGFTRPPRAAPARSSLRWKVSGARGTVEYVGLILLVSLLMVGMVAAMKGFNGKQGTELAEVIVEKVKSAVNTRGS
jgi:hypothetical protein